jgi:hypothetical protein
VRLGHDGSQFLAFGIEGEAFQTVGRLREQHGMKPHTDQVVPERAMVHTMIEALEPAAARFVVIDLMLRSAAFALGFPPLEKTFFVNHQTRFLRPCTQGLASRTVHWGQTAQLPELLRELWDFR